MDGFGIKCVASELISDFQVKEGGGGEEGGGKIGEGKRFFFFFFFLSTPKAAQINMASELISELQI